MVERESGYIFNDTSAVQLQQISVNVEEEFVGPVKVSSRSLLEEIGRLRVQVWKHEGVDIEVDPILGKCWLDNHDLHAEQWVVWRGNSIVAAGRFCIHNLVEEIPEYEYFDCFTDTIKRLPTPIASMNRLVVCPSARRHGLASKIDRVRIEAAERMGARSIVVDVPPYRLEHMKKLGFIVIGLDSSLEYRPNESLSQLIFRGIGNCYLCTKRLFPRDEPN